VCGCVETGRGKKGSNRDETVVVGIMQQGALDAVKR
jgi:hypothetical protein